MALTADKKTEWMEGRDIVFKGMIAGKIYAGALVGAITQLGFLTIVPAADEANMVVLGIALENKDVSPGNNTILVRTTGVVKLKDIGGKVLPGTELYVVDDETVTDNASDTTNAVIAGKLVKLDDDPNYAWVRIG